MALQQEQLGASDRAWFDQRVPLMLERWDVTHSAAPKESLGGQGA
jgi:hypothetical protein